MLLLALVIAAPTLGACGEYVLTSDGIRAATLYIKLKNRLLRPLLDADKPPATIQTRRALATLDRAVNQYIDNARLAPAA